MVAALTHQDIVTGLSAVLASQEVVEKALDADAHDGASPRKAFVRPLHASTLMRSPEKVIYGEAGFSRATRAVRSAFHCSAIDSALIPIAPQRRHSNARKADWVSRPRTDES
ncbi:hypothetical protein BZM27_37405 [Paraburkholderia steynii]|uniref:Uncharacterized protein n=1 Tax=Paraburkholderia steynii TaxID=1245441 RepID=A0A4R0XDJ0_9BURK|nr:hypothetical protein BZM27_37405 [Paraburkholderia steynii]